MCDCIVHELAIRYGSESASGNGAETFSRAVCPSKATNSTIDAQDAGSVPASDPFATPDAIASSNDGTPANSDEHTPGQDAQSEHDSASDHIEVICPAISVDNAVSKQQHHPPDKPAERTAGPNVTLALKHTGSLYTTAFDLENEPRAVQPDDPTRDRQYAYLQSDIFVALVRGQGSKQHVHHENHA